MTIIANRKHFVLLLVDACFTVTRNGHDMASLFVDKYDAPCRDNTYIALLTTIQTFDDSDLNTLAADLVELEGE